MDIVNSKEYWDKHFGTGDWDKNNGKEQSLFFAELAYDIMPDFLKQELGRNSWTVVDIGCAEGEGTASLARRFPLCKFTGVDFSDEAIKTATQQHPNCDFLVKDVYKEIIEADVVFSSNTLEHLKNPRNLMERMCGAAKKYLVLLLPLEDYFMRVDEHINTFSLEVFPLHIATFYLSSYRIVDCANMAGTRWSGKQILLVYTSQAYCKEQLTLRDVHDNFVGEKAQRVAGLEAQLRELENQSEVRIQELKNQCQTHTQELVACQSEIAALEDQTAQLQQANEQLQKDNYIRYKSLQAAEAELDLKRESLDNHQKLLAENQLLLLNVYEAVSAVQHSRAYRICLLLKRVKFQLLKCGWAGREDLFRWIWGKLRGKIVGRPLQDFDQLVSPLQQLLWQSERNNQLIPGTSAPGN